MLLSYVIFEYDSDDDDTDNDSEFKKNEQSISGSFIKSTYLCDELIFCKTETSLALNDVKQMVATSTVTLFNSIHINVFV